MKEVTVELDKFGENEQEQNEGQSVSKGNVPLFSLKGIYARTTTFNATQGDCDQSHYADQYRYEHPTPIWFSAFK
ncbi:hypothetical protein, partial [Escherichia coli]|uniref:hypothetical protein n=1 Tax=Escherichia coli TaxID=562 RepID=UPI001961E745